MFMDREVIVMVMRSFKCKSITIPVPKSKMATYTTRLKKEFGGNRWE